ncbi:RabGAP/TBC [Cutaneotrichosporon oleaginosum]|uniref:RabGAP/TBC n=1 Tax=Cutaneotrichosporon oleaginosum TaxID=879819 RepID=A0A0J0XC06_9TREE|nr:RabGAP/TBC [Cutaneotrichosporon oleaginosum]KLT38608.1 RabGAP/TBC [Cutaneotrichosporon oleaginosum]TXT05807.1 hypothetical protein COLE_07127 [Cutaneotrichosporon oleaginosum]
MPGGPEELEELDASQYSDDDEEQDVYTTPRPFHATDYVSVPLQQQRSRDDDWEFARPATAQDFTRQDDEWSVGGHSEGGVQHPAPQGIAVGQALTHDYAHPAQRHVVPHQLAQTWIAEPVTPEKTSRSSRTPPRTPEVVVHQSPDPPGERRSSSAVPLRLRVDTSPQTPPGLSPTESSSPVHPSIARIAASSRNGSAVSSLAASNTSLVSSQYPGEDTDAYHVRSTYARLDIEGVFGDGWDEGVERTRGGIGSGSRMTTTWPDTGIMSDQELKFLKSLDRYGFVDRNTLTRSEHRLVRVPVAPFSSHPKVSAKRATEVKVPAAKGPPPSPPGLPPGGPSRTDETRQRKKEAERVNKWMAMMSVAERDEGRNVTGWRWSSKEAGKHKTRVWKGIPDRWRMAAWWTLAEAAANDARRKGERVPGHEALEADYTVRKDLPSTNDVQIDLDVPRTISGHALFRTRFGHGQRALFHVLHAFSQSCGTCGYCQGMGSVAATLLCYFEPERTYSLMVRLHDLYDMHGMFAPGFPGLLETFYVQERLMESILPDVYMSFKRNMISSSAWGAKIYITLFVNVVPFNVQLRLWDAMFLDGIDVMIIAVIALLWAYRRELAHPSADFESILSLLSSYYVPEDDDAMLEWMRRLLWQPGVRDLITHWRREWRRKVEQGVAMEALL